MHKVVVYHFEFKEISTKYMNVDVYFGTERYYKIEGSNLIPKKRHRFLHINKVYQGI